MIACKILNRTTPVVLDWHEELESAGHVLVEIRLWQPRPAQSKGYNPWG